MAKRKAIKVPRDIADALKRFPADVKRREKIAREQQVFLKKTFGPLVKELLKMQAKEKKGR